LYTHTVEEMKEVLQELEEEVKIKRLEGKRLEKKVFDMRKGMYIYTYVYIRVRIFFTYVHIYSCKCIHVYIFM